MRRSVGMKIFMVIWVGQLVSRVGTALTRFALLIWAYQQTDSASMVALLGFFSYLPLFLVSPIAGVWVDRLARRKIMLLADVGAGVMTLALLLLYASGNLQIWHLFVMNILAGAFEAFQRPAYTALSSELLPKEQYGRASGLRSLAESGANIVAPVIAGLLLGWADISGVMLLDLFTLCVAVGTLLLVSLPGFKVKPARTQQDDSSDGAAASFWQDVGFGFRYIRRQPGLLGLTVIYTGLNFLDSLTWFSILPVMILARSGGDEMVLASVQGSFGVAGVCGGLLVSIWGGPKRKIHGALAGQALSFALGGLLMALGASVLWWMAAAWVAMFFVPFISSSVLAIWQSKTAPGVQGRVLSAYEMLRQSTAPLGFLLGGVLADRWFEPLMMPDGGLAPVFGPLVGAGPGSGMALMFLATAALGGLLGMAGYLFPAVRNVEGETAAEERESPLGVLAQSA